MPANAMSEERMVGLVRNSLLVAGHEMGAEGDHWPLINSTIHSIMKDWENLKVERNVSAELKKHYGDIINQMEKNLALCPADLRPDATKLVQEMREVYDACFAPVDMSMTVICDADIPIHVKRVEAIMQTLEEEND